MFCTNCGKQQPDGAKFCTNCGAPLAAPKSAGQTMRQPVTQQPAPAPTPAPARAATPAPTPTPEPDKKPGRGRGIGVAIACAVIVIAAAVAVYFILFAGNSGDSAQVAAAPATTVAASTDAAAEPATTSDTPATTGPASPDAGNGANASAQENVGEAREAGDVTYTDPHYGFQLRLPDSYAITSDSGDGITYTDAASQISVYAYAMQSAGETPHSMLENLSAETSPEYKAEGDDWCVASWKADGYEYYFKTYVTGGYDYGIQFSYPLSSAQAGSDLIEAYIQYFKPGTE